MRDATATRLHTKCFCLQIICILVLMLTASRAPKLSYDLANYPKTSIVIIIGTHWALVNMPFKFSFGSLRRHWQRLPLEVLYTLQEWHFSKAMEKYLLRTRYGIRLLPWGHWSTSTPSGNISTLHLYKTWESKEIASGFLVVINASYRYMQSGYARFTLKS